MKLHGITNHKFAKFFESKEDEGRERVRNDSWTDGRTYRTFRIEVRETGDQTITAGRPDHDQQHCYHHTPTVNQRLLLQLIGS